MRARLRPLCRGGSLWESRAGPQPLPGPEPGLHSGSRLLLLLSRRLRPGGAVGWASGSLGPALLPARASLGAGLGWALFPEAFLVSRARRGPPAHAGAGPGCSARAKTLPSGPRRLARPHPALAEPPGGPAISARQHRLWPNARPDVSRRCRAGALTPALKHLAVALPASLAGGPGALMGPKDLRAQLLLERFSGGREAEGPPRARGPGPRRRRAGSARSGDLLGLPAPRGALGSRSAAARPGRRQLAPWGRGSRGREPEHGWGLGRSRASRPGHGLLGPEGARAPGGPARQCRFSSRQSRAPGSPRFWDPCVRPVCGVGRGRPHRTVRRLFLRDSER